MEGGEEGTGGEKGQEGELGEGERGPVTWEGERDGTARPWAGPGGPARGEKAGRGGGSALGVQPSIGKIVPLFMIPLGSNASFNLASR